ncbi:MAG: hypothetical protein COB59_08715 [Rhodospirillaceae bacterium]|nr:MAG: hypothetical protein COB59_08715 [Rhodospirillaceae bacterium]
MKDIYFPPLNRLIFKARLRTQARAWARYRGLALLVGTGICLGLFSSTMAYAGKTKKPKVKISEKRSLQLGTVAGSSDGPSTIILSPSGAVTTTGYGFVLKDQFKVGKYRVEGPDNANVLITLPNTVTLSSGSSQAILSNFTSSPSGVGTLNNHGKLTIKVGATLSIPTGQTGGEYTGPITIYVDLQ